MKIWKEMKNWKKNENLKIKTIGPFQIAMYSTVFLRKIINNVSNPNELIDFYCSNNSETGENYLLSLL